MNRSITLTDVIAAPIRFQDGNGSSYDNKYITRLTILIPLTPPVLPSSVCLL